MKDYTGMKFHKLTGIRPDHEVSGRKWYWEWQCDCGNKVVARTDCVVSGNTKSCGCLVHNRPLRPEQHGFSHEKLYHVFHGMKQRCYNPKCTSYKHYGQRGIRIHQAWLDDYRTFREWAYDNGYREDLTIERVDVNGDYEPNNCKWITLNEQTLNTRRSTRIEIDGVTKNLCEWCKEYGVNMATACHRIKRGYPMKRVFGISE